jgi:hypothetical protein
MADNGDIKAHEATYNGVMSFLKWGSIVTAIITALVVYLISA